MNKTVEVNTMKFDGKEFFEVDLLDSGKNKYNFFAEIDNPKNVKVFKLVVVDGEEYLDPINGEELDEALKLFVKKYN